MSAGVKYDKGKRRWSLIPWDALEWVVQALEYGADKYPEADNWKRVEDPRVRYTEAAIRHLVAPLKGEWFDPESKLPHLAHGGACILFLLWFGEKPKAKPMGELPYKCKCGLTYSDKGGLFNHFNTYRPGAHLEDHGEVMPVDEKVERAALGVHEYQEHRDGSVFCDSCSNTGGGGAYLNLREFLRHHEGNR